MSRFWDVMVTSVVLAALGSLTGCTLEGPPKTSVTKGKVTEPAHEHEHHEHAQMHGPNGGPVLELGHEEYHAEWLHNEESGTVTVFILDSTGEKELAIDASELTIDTLVAGKSSSYKLSAAGEPDQPSAKFEVENKTLIAALEGAGQKGTEATLRVSISGKEYTAQFERHEH